MLWCLMYEITLTWFSYFVFDVWFARTSVQEYSIIWPLAIPSVLFVFPLTKLGMLHLTHHPPPISTDSNFSEKRQRSASENNSKACFHSLFFSQALMAALQLIMSGSPSPSLKSSSKEMARLHAPPKLHALIAALKDTTSGCSR